MSLNIPLSSSVPGSAGTPQNSYVPGAEPVAGRAKPTVTDIEEDEDDDEHPDFSSLAQNPALAALVQNKLAGLVGQTSGYVESLPVAVRNRVEGLKGVQIEQAKIEGEFQLEILELEKRFAAKYAPLYERRAAIIAGKLEPTDDEIRAGQAIDEDEDDEDEARITELNNESGEGIAGIPEFWLTALRNHSGISELITEADEEALKSLTDIQLSYLSSTSTPPSKPGFRLSFVFAENEFFSSTTLEKTYYYQEEIGYAGDFVYDKAEGCTIAWKADKDLTKTIEVKKQRNKSTGKTRVVKKIVPTDSFFNFFSPPSPPSIEDLENGDVDESELEDLDERLELDYQIGEDLKERVIPRAIDWFTGKAIEYEGDEDDEGSFDDEDDYDEEEDEEDEEAAPTQQQSEECKQQ